MSIQLDSRNYTDRPYVRDWLPGGALYDSDPEGSFWRDKLNKFLLAHNYLHAKVIFARDPSRKMAFVVWFHHPLSVQHCAERYACWDGSKQEPRAPGEWLIDMLLADSPFSRLSTKERDDFRKARNQEAADEEAKKLEEKRLKIGENLTQTATGHPDNKDVRELKNMMGERPKFTVSEPLDSEPIPAPESESAPVESPAAPAVEEAAAKAPRVHHRAAHKK